MLCFYKAYVIPTRTYGVLIYGNTFQPHLTEIMKSQKRILRAICFKRRYESIKESMDENNCLLFLICFFKKFKYLFTELRSDKENSYV